MDKQDLHMNGADGGWVWAVQGRIDLSCRSSDFSDWRSFRKWLFDPEFGLERSQRVYPAKEPSRLVKAFWPHAALRIMGIDVALGLFVRAPITNFDLKEKSDG